MNPPETVPSQNRGSSIWRDRTELIWLSLIVVLGFVLRIIRLGTDGFWHDEIHNLFKTEQISAVLLRGDLVSNHPPLFAVLATIWRTLGPGPGEWWMRLLPLTLGLGAVVALYFLGKKIFGSRAGLFAAFLLAISPFHVLHSQDLKVYILLPFTGILMVHCLYLATERNRASFWVLYAVTAALACYSDFFAAPLLIGVNLWFLLQLRGRLDRLRGWILANIGGALLLLPQFGILRLKAGNIMFSAPEWWVLKPTPWSIVFYFKTIAFGYSNLEPHFKIALFIFCVFALVGIVLSWKKDWRPALLLILWFAVPVTLVYAVSHLIQSIFLTRALLPYAMPFYLWIGLAVSRAKPWPIRGALTLLFACIAALPLAQMYRGEYSLREWPHRPATHAPMRYREAAQAVLSKLEEGDAVLHAGDWSWVPFYWYGFRELPGCTHQSVAAETGFIEYFKLANPSPTDRDDLRALWPTYVQPVVEGKSRCWYVFSQWDREYLIYNALPTWRWLDAHYPEVGHMDFDAFEVFLYAKEQNGQPVRVMARDEDDGVTATITYAGGFEGTYKKHKADWGLAPSPPAARRGNLTLRFDEETVAQPVSFARGDTSRIVSFAIENRSDQEARCRVEFVVTDHLLDVASLYESQPSSDVWTVSPMPNPVPPPGDYEIPTALAHINSVEFATLHGGIELAPGTYETFVYLLCRPGGPIDRLPGIQLAVGEQVLLAELTQVQTKVDGWRWLATAPVTISPEETSVPVSVTVGGAQGAEGREIGLAYVGFRKVADTQRTEENQAIIPTWPGEVTLSPSSTTRWSPEIDVDAGRVDVWVYERGPDGRGYRIFKILRD